MYRWDDDKAAGNEAKHGVPFDAVLEFEWETALARAYRRHGEIRHEVMGYIGLRLYVLVCTIEPGAVRVISLRKANGREVRRYAET